MVPPEPPEVGSPKLPNLHERQDPEMLRVFSSLTNGRVPVHTIARMMIKSTLMKKISINPVKLLMELARKQPPLLMKLLTTDVASRKGVKVPKSKQRTGE